jgi:methylase of polypeptide subunit release factors
MRHKEEVAVTGVDISEAAVAITRHNVAKEMGDSTATSDIFAGDWYDEKIWRRLGRHTYDVIMCNPPYLAPGTPLMDGYEAVPREAVYAEDDGLAHHRFLMPRLLGLLSVRNGATLITRFHSTIRGENDLSQRIDTVVSESVVQAPPISDFAIVRRILAPVAAGRNMATVTISRSEGWTPQHMSPPYAR